MRRHVCGGCVSIRSAWDNDQNGNRYDDTIVPDKPTAAHVRCESVELGPHKLRPNLIINYVLNSVRSVGSFIISAITAHSQCEARPVHADSETTPVYARPSDFMVTYICAGRRPSWQRRGVGRRSCLNARIIIME